jgi:hypothetical protein
MANQVKGEYMEKRAWTARGTMTEADTRVIASVVAHDKTAARIFVTGEVHENYIGDLAARHLMNVNDVLYKNGAGSEPLFVDTKDNTIRMTRFDPNIAWRCLDPDILVALVTEEIKRLGVKMDPWAMDYFDFYESMVGAFKKEKSVFTIPVPEKGKDSINTFYSGVYLSCLVLFGKPGYMDITVAQHFASPDVALHLREIECFELNAEQQEEVIKLREDYGNIQALTNPELKFIVSIYAGESKWF